MESTSGKRERGNSFNQADQVGLEELTVMKLMEEIMELDQEIKLKQSWINTRMKMLHNLLPKQQKQDTRKIIEKFLLKLQPEYPSKVYVKYERKGEAIPMPMDSGEPIALEMFKGDPIPLQAQEDLGANENQQKAEEDAVQHN